MNNLIPPRPAHRFLIIDDDANTLLALPALIKIHFPHAIIQTAINADTALIWLRNFHYDLILLDIWLPRIDGLTLLRDFGGDLRGTPVIVMTGNLDVSLKSQAFKRGAYACLEKPLLPLVLIDTMKDALDSRAQTQVQVDAG